MEQAPAGQSVARLRRVLKAVRKLSGPVIVQASHRLARRFVKNNGEWAEPDEEGEESFCDRSARRAAVLGSGLRKMLAPRLLEDIAAVFAVEPVLNENTYQRMAFCPHPGEVKVWRRL